MGRMLEPAEIFADEIGFLRAPKVLAGKRVLVTAGPTEEPIDPVRGITNASSGKMGYAVARAAREAGADVTLVSGPVSLPTPAGVARVDVRTAREMFDAVKKDAKDADIFIAVAAVADYRVKNPAAQKIKKGERPPLARARGEPGHPRLGRRAAEGRRSASASPPRARTCANAQAKREEEAAADRRQPGAGRARRDDNEVTLYDASGEHALAAGRSSSWRAS